jgi:hypothetical protein
LSRVGIDWGNSHHQLCVLDSAGQLVEQGSVTHDVAGISELQNRLRRRAPITGVAIERSEGLLVESLQAQGHRLFCVSPKLSARARRAGLVRAHGVLCFLLSRLFRRRRIIRVCLSPSLRFRYHAWSITPAPMTTASGFSQWITLRPLSRAAYIVERAAPADVAALRKFLAFRCVVAIHRSLEISPLGSAVSMRSIPQSRQMLVIARVEAWAVTSEST